MTSDLHHRTPQLSVVSIHAFQPANLPNFKPSRLSACLRIECFCIFKFKSPLVPLEAFELIPCSPFMIYYFPILPTAKTRASKCGSDGPESGRGCELRPGVHTEWASELQGETHWGLAYAGAATVSRAKGIEYQICT